jgi:DNA-binding protein H-NS
MNLRKLSLQQLEKLSEKIERRREQLRRVHALDVRRRVLAEIRSAGLSLADVLAGARPKRAPTAAAKGKPARRRGRRRRAAAAAAVRGMTYINPADTTETWSGYGRRPQWYLDAIASGKTEAQLRADGGSAKAGDKPAPAAKAAKATKTTKATGKRGKRRRAKRAKAAKAAKAA